MGVRFRKVKDDVLALVLSQKGVNLAIDTEASYYVTQKAYTILSVVANCKTAPTGSTIIIDITKNGSTIFTTKLTIDISETTSTTALVPYVLNTTSFAVGDIIVCKIDQVGSTITGKDLLVQFIVAPL